MKLVYCVGAAILGSTLAAQPCFPQSPPAPTIGRYQIVAIPKPGEFGAALVLDTATGDVWYWFQAIGTNGKLGSVIQYEGRAIPGAEPGQSVARHGFGENAIPNSK